VLPFDTNTRLMHGHTYTILFIGLLIKIECAPTIEYDISRGNSSYLFPCALIYIKKDN